MDLDLEYEIYKISLGFYEIEIDSILYKVVAPTTDIKLRAQRLYQSFIDDNKFNDTQWISASEIDYILRSNGIWNDHKQKELTYSLKNLEQNKIQIYLNFHNKSLLKTARSNLISTKKKINDLHSDKYSLSHLTLEDYAYGVKNRFIVANTVYHNNELVFETDMDSMDAILMDRMLLEIRHNTLGIDDLKLLIKHDLWKSYWISNKEHIFAGPPTTWTDEQRVLVSLNKTHDSIREHTECPDEEILEDSDALEGWMIFQNDKRQKEIKKKSLEDRLGIKNTKAGSQESFIVTTNREEAHEIYGLNDRGVLEDMKEMHTIAKEKGEVQWTELPSVREQAVQEFLQKG